MNQLVFRPAWVLLFLRPAALHPAGVGCSQALAVCHTSTKAVRQGHRRLSHPPVASVTVCHGSSGRTEPDLADGWNGGVPGATVGWSSGLVEVVLEPSEEEEPRWPPPIGRWGGPGRWVARGEGSDGSLEVRHASTRVDLPRTTCRSRFFFLGGGFRV